MDIPSQLTTPLQVLILFLLLDGGHYWPRKLVWGQPFFIFRKETAFRSAGAPPFSSSCWSKAFAFQKGKVFSTHSTAWAPFLPPLPVKTAPFFFLSSAWSCSLLNWISRGFLFSLTPGNERELSCRTAFFSRIFFSLP